MTPIVLYLFSFFFLFHSHGIKLMPPPTGNNLIIGDGEMPQTCTDKSGTVHLVYGHGDTLIYSASADQGLSFSTPKTVSIIPKLVDYAMRGPQIAATSTGIVIIAANAAGDLFAFKKTENASWKRTSRVNDIDTIAKEGFTALAASGNTVVAVWLDLRNTRKNKIVASVSEDGGLTWGKNKIVYDSPDTGICECCKPSALMHGKDLYILFRNNVTGNRDMYLIHSPDAGKSFEPAKKTGTVSWKLNGCPMDGGGMTFDQQDKIQTVWRRQGKIYFSGPGKNEIEIAEGKNGVIENAGGKNIYAWNANGEIVCRVPGKGNQVLGKGSIPVLKKINNHMVLCAWDDGGKIYVHRLSI